MKNEKKKYHIDKDYVRSPRVFEPFMLYQICDLACSSDYEVREHTHECYEISYIVSGEGTFSRNGQIYKVTPGMLFLISKNDTHYIRSDKLNPLRYVCMGFSFDENSPLFKPYTKIRDFWENCDNPITIDIYNIFNSFTQALSEISSPNDLQDEMIKSYLSQIIILTYRSFQKQPLMHYYSRLDVNDTNPIIYEIINYIDMNCTRIKNLNVLSIELGYSYGYMSKIFSKTMGITIKEYFNNQRFKIAVELLEENISISEISAKLGFADTPSFCKAFRQHYQLPPGEYRKGITERTD